METNKYPHFEKQLRIYLDGKKITQKDMQNMSLIEVCKVNEEVALEINRLYKRKNDLFSEYKNTGIKTEEYFDSLNKLNSLTQALSWIAPIIVSKVTLISEN